MGISYVAECLTLRRRIDSVGEGSQMEPSLCPLHADVFRRIPAPLPLV
jgi:hypothetical protein